MKKLLLIPTLLTASAPLFSLVGCGSKEIVLDNFYKIPYGEDTYLNAMITKNPYSIKEDTKYDFTIDMRKWQGSKQDVHHFTFVIGKKDVGGNPSVCFDPNNCSFKIGDRALTLAFPYPDIYHNAVIDFNETEDINEILQSQYINCSIQTTTKLEQNNNVIGEYYFIFYEGILN